MKMPTSVPIELLHRPKALYDFFMKYLAPDLVTENLPHLDEPYIGETVEERTERYARYADACRTLGSVITALDDDMKQRARDIIRSIDAAAHAADATERDAALTSLSHAIDAA